VATLEVTHGQILSQSPTEVAFVWELSKETVVLPLVCLQGGGGGERRGFLAGKHALHKAVRATSTGGVEQLLVVPPQWPHPLGGRTTTGGVEQLH